jgi:hypothetical protein
MIMLTQKTSHGRDQFEDLDGDEDFDPDLADEQENEYPF